ncbi:hypothetical protein FACS1894139_18750 [Planctomycetales bacterium]|nr:hypothetical protein FACS1894139_18750 [Planctomycetales bacterium]
MKIYAINLPRSLDRRAHIEQECERYRGEKESNTICGNFW